MAKMLRKTEELGRRIEDLVSGKVAGQRPDRQLQLWVDGLPDRILKRIISWGLVDNARIEAGRQLHQHLEEWQQSLLAEGCTKTHARTQYAQVKRVFDLCCFRSLGEISASHIQRQVSKLKKTVMRAKGKGQKRQVVPTEIGPASDSTKKYYLQACMQFTKWAYEDRRISNNPLAHLKSLKAQSQPRAPLSPEELLRLISETERSDERFQISGAERAMIYRFASETGFRAGEIRQLKVSDFDLDQQSVILSGKYTKNGKDALIPLRSDTALRLKEHFRGKLPKVNAFNLPSKYNMADMLRKDMKHAREKWFREVEGSPAEYKNRRKSQFLDWQKAEGRVDFHSLRHTFGTMLAASGVHPKIAQDLMRHSDINLTMSRYTHTLHGQTIEAVEALPDLEGKRFRATGTD